MPEPIADAVPAASSLLLRDGREGVEILFLRRNKKLRFHGGSWVFPGGRIDSDDFPDDRPEDEEAAARAAAVRETREEAGLVLDPGRLLYVAHWTTPVISPRRFATWFFMAAAPRSPVEVDGGEIREHRWLRPCDALAAQASGEMAFGAPSFVLTYRIGELGTTAEVLHAFAGRRPDVLLPKIVELAEGRVALYQGDAGYEPADPRAQGRRHRLYMQAGRWRYERSL